MRKYYVVKSDGLIFVTDSTKYKNVLATIHAKNYAEAKIIFDAWRYKNG